MLNFQPITIEDKDKFNAFFLKYTFRNCDFSFSNIFTWRQRYRTSYVIEVGFLFIRFYAGGKKAGYMFPLGDGDLRVAIDMLTADTKERNEPLRFFALTTEMFNAIDQVFPGKFIHQKNRSWYEYIYSAEDLIFLKGKKLQSKRNHINKFKRSYESYEYIPITQEIIPACLELYCKWCIENGGCQEDQSLIDEKQSTQYAFEYFEQLGLKGGALRVNGEIIAYSYGQHLTEDTFGVHAEKSLHRIDGGFTMINQQFAAHECVSYRYVNREEDLGLESLRQAKMSYNPAFLIEKGFAMLADQVNPDSK